MFSRLLMHIVYMNMNKNNVFQKKIKWNTIVVYKKKKDSVKDTR